jgi:hypothetical protein
MADRLKVTELDFDAIKNNLKNFLRQQTEFQDYDFEGAGLNILLDVLAYNTHYNAYYINMTANESFLDTALLRNSVVSHAKKLGYTPRSTKAARAVVNITIDSQSSVPGTLTLPKGYVILSNEVDNRTYNFVTLENYTVEKTANNFVFPLVSVYEGQINSYVYVHSQPNNPRQLFTLPDSNIDTSTIQVTVQPSQSNTDVYVYTKSEDVLGVSSDDTVYFLQEGLDGQYEIYFGDDIFGKKLSDGALVTVQYLSSTGSAPNSANNFVGTSSVGGFTSLIVDSVGAAAGGSPRESVDEIKFSAPLQNISQNRAVTKNDYINIIKQKYPFFEAVNVWGGEENTPPIYGKVFVSAKPKLGFEVTDTIKEFVKENILKPISVLTVTPEIVDVDYNFLKVISTLYYDSTKTTLTKSDLQTNIRQVILNFASVNLNKFNTLFNYNGMERSIQDYSRSIISNEVDLFVGKKFRPDLINTNNYILDYGMELTRGTTSDSFFSTPDFTILDNDGVERRCFFEEIPSSFTGLESVQIVNGGFNYTSTPNVTVIGDGQGAKAVATIVNGKVSNITVTNPGIGYTIATIRISGGGGSLAQASPILQGRYGRIRISFFKPDEITSEQTKVVLNANSNNGVVGTIDYLLGKITIIDFNPIDVNNDFGDITVYMKPKSNIIESKFNKMLVLDAEDPSSVVLNIKSR